MKKKIKKAGNSPVIYLRKNEMKERNWKEGDWVDLSDAVKIGIDEVRELEESN